MEIVFILSAEIDWFNLYQSYEDSFDVPFSHSLDLLKSHPELGPSSRIPTLRRLLIRHTPWAIFYKIESRRLVIIAIEDLRQNPSTIERKLKGLLP